MNSQNTENIQFYNTENAHPQCPIDLQETSNLAIIGAGNVTLDIARIFLRNPDDNVVKDHITTFVYK